MQRLLAHLALVALVAAAGSASSADKQATAASRAALQELNEYIGDWKGSGGPDRPRVDPKDSWAETVSWSWRFKGDDGWLSLTVKNGRHFKGGELRYLPDRKVYQFTAVTRDDKKLVFEGDIRKGYLTLDRTDPETKETQQLRMNTAAEGVRFVYRLSRKAEGRTLFTPDFQVACTKEGESLAKSAKKVECIVTGGLGTIAVSYDGKTYYVCCSGCRDAFTENPAKYVKEAEARKAGKK